MDRHWLITWSCYGTWLPGDPRGFVSRVRDRRADDPITFSRVVHNEPGSDCDKNISGLQEAARSLLKCDPIYLHLEQANLLLEQFQETASHRGWALLAVAVMPNHIHVVVGVMGDPDPENVMGDFKAYGSRKLNRQYGKPASDTWWTDKGSQRKLKDDRAIRAAIEYVRNQAGALVIWIDEAYLNGMASGDLASGPRKGAE